MQRSLAPLLALFLMLALLAHVQATAAQSDEVTPTPPAEEGADIPRFHVVQQGETLLGIAELYGTTVEVLMALNGIEDAGLIYIGQELRLPGGGGEAVAAVRTARVGDSLAGLAAAYNTTPATIAAANRLIQPHYLVAGLPITLTSRTGTAEAAPPTGQSYVVQPGDTLLTIAAAYGLSSAEIMATNGLSIPVYLYPGQPLRLPGSEPYRPLPAPWKVISFYPAPARQGETVALYVESHATGTPTGDFAGQTLRFAPYGEGFLALAGLDAFLEDGRYPLELRLEGSRPWEPFVQQVKVDPGDYGTQYISIPEDLAYLLAPEIRAEEDALLATYFSQFEPEPRWQGAFRVPITNTVVTAPYGAARSYNEGPIEIYHTGVDYAGPVGTPIYAPAAGTVVFSDTMALHGGTVVIDHGLGVMTAYYHLSEIRARVGQVVAGGDLIARGGSTGLSNGPHLHWDLRILGVPVNGQQWLDEDLIARVMAQRSLP
jgi:murein DD-endopeptidase MepM/ murein hydrolase activator NlpD